MPLALEYTIYSFRSLHQQKWVNNTKQILSSDADIYATFKIPHLNVPNYYDAVRSRQAKANTLNL